ncbi:MAG TPA: hypothetical protein VGM43_05805 [Bryobacteraceae bacterium]
MLFAQTAGVPLGVTATRTIAGASRYNFARLGPSGSVYLVGRPGEYAWAVPGHSYGGTPVAAYVSRLDSSGQPVFTTAFGGTSGISSVVVGGDGDAYLSGTASASGFYTSPGAYETSTSIPSVQFACRINGVDGSVRYCTYLDTDAPGRLNVDASGALTIVSPWSTPGYFTPSPTPGALSAGPNHISVVKLSPDGAKVQWIAGFGSSLYGDRVSATGIDPSGNVCVVGATDGTDYPVTPDAATNPFPAVLPPDGVGFVSCIRSDGTAFLWSALGHAGEVPEAVAIDSAGEAQVAYLDLAGVYGLRRYAASGGSVKFDVPFGPTDGTQASFSAGSLAMAIDAADNTSLIFGAATITPPLSHPTATCGFASEDLRDDGFLARFAPDGSIAQATWLKMPFPGISDFSAAGTLTILTFGDDPSVVSLGAAPELQLGCVGNSASFVGDPLAAGEIVALFGSNFTAGAPAIAMPDANGAWPVTLNNTQVTFDGVPAPLLYVAAGQINTVVPFRASNTTNICVVIAGKPSNCMSSPVAPAQPGIFTIPGTSVNHGALYAAAVNQDGSINSPQNPAPRGSIVALFATGLGSLSQTPADGTLVPLPLSTQTLNVYAVWPGAQPHGLTTTDPAQWAGQAPLEFAGLSQINVRVPDYSGSFLNLVVSQGPYSPPYHIWSSNSVNLWIK